MKNNILLIFFTSLIFSFNAMAGPDCIYVPIDIEVTKYDNINLHIVEQECINYPKNYFHNMQEAYFVTQNPNNELLNSVIEIGKKDTRLSEDYIEILKTPSDFPYLVIQATSYSVSNVWIRLHIFSLSPELKKIAIIDEPITKYQANNRNGSEMDVTGFYKSDNEDFYIETLVLRAFQGHKCMACREYNIKTLKMTSKGMKSKGKRHFNIKEYKQRTH
jgi:hypothetical protein